MKILHGVYLDLAAHDSAAQRVCAMFLKISGNNGLWCLIQQQIFREMVVWYRLMGMPHRNIVSFFGFVTDDPGGIGLVSPRFSRGSTTRYIRENPLADRTSLVLRIHLSISLEILAHLTLVDTLVP